ncbi:MAG: UDP-2,3-diacylglucosamine diphosphatase [Pedobacter sp.]|nr:MAG: UDP-2,3-diacylglucosamine diphosphatase [Pedobacter sp.]
MDKKIYFASDFHLGSPNYEESLKREKFVVSWLTEIEPTCSELFLMGDIFDFWFEYKKVVPKGYIRLLGKLTQMADSGIPIYFFKGNHDMWVYDYFIQEIGMKIISDELIIERNNKRFYLHHGDGLGPGDKFYKFLRRIFRNPICQFLFGILPPRIGLGLANYWSGKSRLASQVSEKIIAENEEWLVVHSKEILKKEAINYFVYGHRHLPLEIKLNEESIYINLGEWVNYSSYAEFDGQDLKLKYFKSKQTL